VPVPLPDDEVQRLARLRALSVLDSAPEALFDGLAEAAAAALGTPMAAVNLIDADRLWIKAGVGLEVGGSHPRELTFCTHTILGDGVLEVPDARLDPRFSANPAVRAPDGIRFYAGATIALGDGSRLGALCAVDTVPHRLDEHQRGLLQALAKVAGEALQLRLDSLRREAMLERTGRLAKVGGWTLDLITDTLEWTDQTCRLHDLPPGHRPTLEEALDCYPREARIRLERAIERAREEGGEWDLELPMKTPAGRRRWVRVIGQTEHLDDGQPARVVGAIQDISIRRQVMTALETSERRFRQLFQYSLGLICTHDHEGVLLSVNPAAARALGYSVGELLGRPLTDFIPESRREAFRDYLLRIITTGTDAGLLELIARDGRRLMWQYQNVLDDESEEPYILGHAQDITERFEMERQLRDWSVRDALTGCYNRRYLADLEKSGAARRWLRHGGSGPFQAGQRHLRSPARRRGAAGDGAFPPAARTRRRCGGTPGRRRVPAAAARCRRSGHCRGDRTDRTGPRRGADRLHAGLRHFRRRGVVGRRIGRGRPQTLRTARAGPRRLSCFPRAAVRATMRVPRCRISRIRTMHDFDDELPAEPEDSVEALVWQLLLLVNPGDEDTALRHFAAWRDVQAESGGLADPVETVSEVIDWSAGFRVDDAVTLVQALDELAARWNLSIDWDGDPDDEDFLDEHDAPDLLGTAYDRLLERGYTVWIYESPGAAWAGWITRTDEAEPMREVATALGVNLRPACDAG